MKSFGALREVWVYDEEQQCLIDIYEGDGSNLFEEDEDEGYVDYLVVDIWYDVTEYPTETSIDNLVAERDADDGIQSMLTEPSEQLFHTPEQMADYIADAWGYSGVIVAANF